MWNAPTKKQLSLIPNLYAQENVKDKKIYMKFFMGGWTWYVAEIDHSNWDTMFCYVISPMKYGSGEWGYTSLQELKSMKKDYMQVDRDLYSAKPRKPKLLSTLLKEG